jgi:hypothetical protein
MAYFSLIAVLAWFQLTGASLWEARKEDNMHDAYLFEWRCCRQVDTKRLSIVLGVLLSALLLSSCLCFMVGYHRHKIRKVLQLPRQLSASLKLPLHYERHTEEQKD